MHRLKSFKPKISIKEGTIYFLIALPFLAYILMFNYFTLFGWSYAFVNFRPAFGWQPWNHEFVGFKWFETLWSMRGDLGRVMYNTLSLSFISLALSPLPVLLAILFMEIRSRKLKRITQTITTFPNFISWVIVYGIAFAFFSNFGVIANIGVALGLERQQVSLIADPDYAWTMYITIGIWKSIGWSAIIYCAAISGIDESLYEAAKIDGANKIKQILYITIPGVKETFLVLLLLSFAGLLGSNFDYIFLFHNPMTTERLMTLSFWIYRMGIIKAEYSLSIASSIVMQLIGLILLFSMNWIAKIMRDGRSIV